MDVVLYLVGSEVECVNEFVEVDFWVVFDVVGDVGLCFIYGLLIFVLCLMFWV